MFNECIIRREAPIKPLVPPDSQEQAEPRRISMQCIGSEHVENAELSPGRCERKATCATLRQHLRALCPRSVA